MLNINLEFRKGVLFVRLEGILNKDSVVKLKNEVSLIIKDNGIQNVVFNLSKLDNIDIKGINSLLYCYEIVNKNKGKVMICGMKDNVANKIKRSRLLNYIKETSDELSSFSLVNL